jgi:Flp pilus assembly protein TadG
MAYLWKRAEGQSLVELVIILPILLIILLGVIDFGRVFYAYVTITNAAREGARYGSMYPLSTGEIKSRVKQETTGTLTLSDSDITVTSETETITVTVRCDFQTFFFGNLPYIRDWLSGGAFPIRAQTAMPVIGE